MSTMNKMLKWIGIAEEEDEEILEEIEEEEVAVEPFLPFGKKAKVSSIPGSAPSKVVVIQFQNFDDAKDAADQSASISVFSNRYCFCPILNTLFSILTSAPFSCISLRVIFI